VLRELPQKAREERPQGGPQRVGKHLKKTSEEVPCDAEIDGSRSLVVPNALWSNLPSVSCCSSTQSVRAESFRINFVRKPSSFLIS